jgi:hypothetical protein
MGYILFDNNGNHAGFTASDISKTTDLELVEVDAQEYQALIDAHSSGRVIKKDTNGIPSHYDSRDVMSIDELFTNKQLEITHNFKQAMSHITGIYTDEDIASFPTQEAEAKAWQADSTAATPFIDGLLANRPSVDKATLVQRIIDNANTYKAVAGPAIGKKQHYEDLLYALKGQHEDPEQPDVTKADIDAIVVDYAQLKT